MKRYCFYNKKTNKLSILLLYILCSLSFCSKVEYAENPRISIVSSIPQIWSKISNENFYYSYVYRVIKKNDFIQINLNNNTFDHFEFHYNVFYKSQENKTTSFKNRIFVFIRKNQISFQKLFSCEISEIGQNKIKLNIDKWKGKEAIIKIIVENDETMGTEIFGVFPYNQKRNPKRVMLISLDTVGSNHMSLYGYKKFETTPKLKQLVVNQDDIFVYTNAFGQSWWTLPTHATMFTGLYPSQHNLNRGDIEIELDNKIKIIHEILQEKGIYTYHSCSHYRVSYQFGFNRGVVLFSDHSELKDGEKADSTVKYSIDAIKDNLDKDIFMFLHFFDAHAPYTEYPEDFREVSKDIKPDWDEALIYWNILNIDKGYDPRNRFINKEKYYKKIEDSLKKNERAYDLGIRLLDQKIYSLFEYLKANNLWHTFDIIIVGDHGEEFFEHGGLTHTSLYDNNIRVPFIIKLSESNKSLIPKKSKFINNNVEAHTMIPSMIEEMYNINKKRKSFLTRLNKDNEVFSELFPDLGTIGSLNDRHRFYQASLILNNFKIILTTYSDSKKVFSVRNFEEEFYELYNLKKDPDEKINLFNSFEYKAIAKKLKDKIKKRIEKENKLKYKVIIKGKHSKEKLEKLKSLGYIR